MVLDFSILSTTETNTEQHEMTYQEACKAAKANKGIFYTYDAGNDKIGGVYWCNQRARLIKQWSNDGKVWF